MEEKVLLRFNDGTEIEHTIEHEDGPPPVKVPYEDSNGIEHWFRLKNGDDLALYVEFPD